MLPPVHGNAIVKTASASKPRLWTLTTPAPYFFLRILSHGLHTPPRSASPFLFFPFAITLRDDFEVARMRVTRFLPDAVPSTVPSPLSHCSSFSPLCCCCFSGTIASGCVWYSAKSAESCRNTPEPSLLGVVLAKVEPDTCCCCCGCGCGCCCCCGCGCCCCGCCCCCASGNDEEMLCCGSWRSVSAVETGSLLCPCGVCAAQLVAVGTESRNRLPCGNDTLSSPTALRLLPPPVACSAVSTAARPKLLDAPKPALRVRLCLGLGLSFGAGLAGGDPGLA